LALCGCLIGVGISRIFYPQLHADLVPTETRKNAEPQMQVRMRFEEIENNERAAREGGKALMAAPAIATKLNVELTRSLRRSSSRRSRITYRRLRGDLHSRIQC
jgi:hypothetical protein